MPKSHPKNVTYNVSDARDNLYSMVKDAGTGMYTYEITQRDGEPVVLMSKEEYESWQETLDIMSDPVEYGAILAAQKSKKRISWAQMMKDLGLKDDDLI